MFQFEFDGALFTLQYRAPALRPLFTLPPTYSARQETPALARPIRIFTRGLPPPIPLTSTRYAGESAAPMYQYEDDGA